MDFINLALDIECFLNNFGKKKKNSSGENTEGVGPAISCCIQVDLVGLARHRPLAGKQNSCQHKFGVKQRNVVHEGKPSVLFFIVF